MYGEEKFHCHTFNELAVVDYNLLFNLKPKLFVLKKKEKRKINNMKQEGTGEKRVLSPWENGYAQNRIYLRIGEL